jgi:hypothetical protein
VLPCLTFNDLFRLGYAGLLPYHQGGNFQRTPYATTLQRSNDMQYPSAHIAIRQGLACPQGGTLARRGPPHITTSPFHPFSIFRTFVFRMKPRTLPALDLDRGPWQSGSMGTTIVGADGRTVPIIGDGRVRPSADTVSASALRRQTPMVCLTPWSPSAVVRDAVSSLPYPPTFK